MKKKNKLLIILLCMVLSYLLFAFEKWDINPGNWIEKERVGASVTALSAAAIILCLNFLKHE